MLDYHLHLWPHGERDTPPTLDQLARYVARAAEGGVTEIAITEHLFRFTQAGDVLAGFWDEDESNPALRSQMADYWGGHCTADLDAYVECVLQAKHAGLPVVLGLEVDYYRGRMDKVATLLDQYPFDVLLGSVHWLGGWMFDVLSSDIAMGEWDARGIETTWKDYVGALEELAATGAVDVLAHPDLAKVTGRRPDRGLLDELEERIAEAAASSGIAAEVSSAGWRKPAGEMYPSPTLLQRFRAKGVPITTASDAHRVDEVADRAADLRPAIVAAGYTTLRSYRARQGAEVPLDVDPGRAL